MRGEKEWAKGKDERKWQKEKNFEGKDMGNSGKKGLGDRGRTRKKRKKNPSARNVGGTKRPSGRNKTGKRREQDENKTILLIGLDLV